MQEGQLLMTQADRDRLVTLKKAKKRLITQRAAAEELGLSTRQVKRLLYALKKRGDKAVIHGLRGKPSNRRIEEAIEREARCASSPTICNNSATRRCIRWAVQPSIRGTRPMFRSTVKCGNKPTSWMT